MMPNTYDYTFDCAALNALLPAQAGPAASVIVTHWQGTEAVSRPYRFEITLALAQGDLALEKLLNQPATLTTSAPDGTKRQWHGILTQGAEQGRDETHYYYQVVLEPRLARLRAMRWSDVYLNRDLSDLIKQLLGYAGLTEPYSTDSAPYDYRIAATQLTQTQADFACQFEETCLDFLMRKLEYYGVYFWFEQGSGQESVVFANGVEQQPTTPVAAVYYAKGTTVPDSHEIAIMRLNRRVGMPPAIVVLHDSPDHGNTNLTLMSQAAVPKPAGLDALGEIHSADAHFLQLDSTTAVSGGMLATWRSEELSCQRLRVEGEARTPGVGAAMLLAVSEYLRGSDARQYYVTEVTHEGSQTLESAPQTDILAYRATFVAQPRFIDPDDDTSAPLQYRAPRSTPVPQVSRLVNGFVDIATPGQPQRFAQPDAYGRYKVRFLFARQRYAGDQNSAFLRMATPYAGGASAQGVSDAGMHFPLREGTEVLIAFLNGNPDRPVIVAALPNSEALSVVTSDNAGNYTSVTPGGNNVSMYDTTTDGDQPAGANGAICLFNPWEAGAAPSHTATDNESGTWLNLGKSNQSDVDDGFLLTTPLHGQVYAGKSLLIDVPGHYRVSAGSDSGGTLANFLGSTAEGLPTGISASQSGGIVISNFVGLKIESVAALTIGHYLGGKVDFTEALTFETNIGAKLSVQFAASKEIDLTEKNCVRADSNYTHAVTKWIAGKWKGIAVEREDTVGKWNIEALTGYQLVTPEVFLGVPELSYLTVTPEEVSLKSTDMALEGELSVTVSSPLVTTVKGMNSSLVLANAGATLSAASITMAALESVSISGTGTATLNGGVISIG